MFCYKERRHGLNDLLSPVEYKEKFNHSSDVSTGLGPIQFYSEVAEKVESERVRDVFRNLVEMEESELRQLAFSALQVRDELGLLQRVEDLSAEQFITQAAVDRLAVAVLPGAARCDVRRLAAHLLQPGA